jgi:hypothetical protein
MKTRADDETAAILLRTAINQSESGFAWVHFTAVTERGARRHWNKVSSGESNSQAYPYQTREGLFLQAKESSSPDSGILFGGVYMETSESV